MNHRFLALLLPIVGVLAGCGEDGPDRTAAAADTVASDTVVTIERSRFDLPDLTVAVGTTVVFVNEDPFAHTVTSRDDSPVAFDSGEMAEDAVFEITFDRPGTYRYFCAIHPTMRGTVVVG